MRKAIFWALLLPTSSLACKIQEPSTAPCVTTTDGGAVAGSCIPVAGTYNETVLTATLSCPIGVDGGRNASDGEWAEFTDQISITQSSSNMSQLFLTIGSGVVSGAELTGVLHTDGTADFGESFDGGIGPVDADTSAGAVSGTLLLAGQFTAKAGSATFAGTYYFDPGASTGTVAPITDGCKLVGDTSWTVAP